MVRWRQPYGLDQRVLCPLSLLFVFGWRMCPMLSCLTPFPPLLRVLLLAGPMVQQLKAGVQALAGPWVPPTE
jgi:hypothetical protein